MEWLRLRKRVADREHQVALVRWRSRPDYWLCDRDECDGLPHDRWVSNHARKIDGRSQAAPEGRWRSAYWAGGRGAGKGFAASNVLADMILDSEPGEWAIVAPTFADGRDVCMIGPSGLIRALGGKPGPSGRLIETGPWIRPDGWHVSVGQLDLINGSKVYIDGADDGALRIQGRNLRGCWADELGLWKDWKTAWDESLRYAVRLSPARIIASGTPKANRSARDLIRRLIDDPAIPVNRLRTEDNAANLDPDQLADWLLAKGTRMAAQELEGELLRDREGALVAWDDIIPYRVTEEDLPVMRRVLVSVDPSFSNSETSDECGIVAVGEGADDHHAYILADWSGRYSIDTWSKRAVLLAWFLSANAIIYESNLVGNIVRTNLESAITDFLTRPEAWGDPDLAREMMQLGLDGKPTNWVPPRLKPAQAKLPKLGRLEVVAPLWQQHRVHHLITVDGSGVGMMQDILENQITSWVPEDGTSPDRLDSCLVAGTLIGTDRGDVPIEEVTTADRVMTRRGWRRVVWSGMTNSNAEVGRLETTAGVLEGTRGHPVLVDAEFLPMDATAQGDRLTGWEQPKRSSSKGSRSFVTRKPKRGRRGSTSRRTRTPVGSRAWANSTSKSGGPPTAESPFRTAISSITSTMTRSTTTRRTLKPSRLRTMANSTRANGYTTSPGLPGSGLSRRNGIGPRKVGRGIASMASRRGITVRGWNAHANRAASPSLPERRSEPCSVLRHAGRPSVIALASRGVRCRVLFAERPFSRIRTDPNLRLVDVYVVKPFVISGREPVYNLMIEGQPEFFANGVLVHNCTQAIAELGLHKRRPRRRPSGLMTEVVAQTV